MTPYAGDPNAFPSTFDLPDDSDPPAAATFNVAPEALGDRTASLAAGYRTELADTTALKAIDTTSIPNGATRVVTGNGRYVLNTASSETEALPVIVAPTTGPGRWEAQDDEAKRQWSVVMPTAGTSGTLPSVIRRVAYEGWGSGGGGGGGSGSNTGSGGNGPGGGAGAGALKCRGETDVTPGGSWTYANLGGGAGGAGGTGGGPGGDGAGGDDSTWTQGGVQIVCPGGQGGRGGGIGAGTAQLVIPGGSNAGAGSPLCAEFYTASSSKPQMVCGPGAGGWAADNYLPGNGASHGARSLEGFSGGAVGVVGTTHTNPGGGAGGGGGAGPAGAGGHGGNGGDGAASGDGGNGTQGAAPTALSGAGGGGGGGAGNGSTTGAVGGDGRTGATGQFTIRGVH